ncbi:conjugal transfer protein TrbF [Hyphomonas sp.]|uniref:conjugal transfer protein TrbF n=1 Tax=Hyphomonas sp. TaxID=87 RepID=UPI00391B05D5
MRFPFRAPATSYAPPPPDTPYRRAQAEWDARMGSAVLSAASWRRIAFAALVLAAGLGAALTLVALQQRTFVHVVEVAPEGQVLSVRTNAGSWTPDAAQTAYFIGAFVRQVRSRPTDAVVLRENWLTAYKFVTPEAATKLSAIAREEDPFRTVGSAARTVHIRSIVQRSDRSWQVSWTEEEAGPASPARGSFTGLFTVSHVPPKRAGDVAVNPLGLYITDFSWSRDQ